MGREARTLGGARLKVFSVSSKNTAVTGVVHRFAPSDVMMTGTESDMIQDFILSLNENEAISPTDLARSLRCSQASVIEAGSDLDAFISLELEGDVGSFIAHPNTIRKFRIQADLPASFAGNPGEGDISLPDQGRLPDQVPAGLPPIGPR